VLAPEWMLPIALGMPVVVAPLWILPPALLGVIGYVVYLLLEAGARHVLRLR